MSGEGFIRDHSLRPIDLVPFAGSSRHRTSLTALLGPLPCVGDVLAMVGPFQILQGRRGVYAATEDGLAPTDWHPTRDLRGVKWLTCRHAPHPGEVFIVDKLNGETFCAGCFSGDLDD